jgi:hypothetical protein
MTGRGLEDAVETSMKALRLKTFCASVVNYYLNKKILWGLEGVLTLSCSEIGPIKGTVVERKCKKVEWENLRYSSTYSILDSRLWF